MSDSPRSTPPRTIVAFGVALWLAACFGGDPSGDETSDDGGLGDLSGLSCGVEGQGVACTGPGGCAGGQTCRSDGTFGPCDCGTLPTAMDAGAPPDEALPPPEPPACGVGSACESDGDCPAGFFCVPQLDLNLPVTGLPTSEPLLPVTLYPGGVCSPIPLQEFGAPGACDPFALPDEQGCGGCGTCSGFNGQQGLVVACTESCAPKAATRGCSRPEYTCDETTHTCQSGCESDTQCKLQTVDSNGDGLADMNLYDPDSLGYCDEVTLRCRHPGTPDAQAGDPCTRQEDCEADGFCFGAERFFAQSPYVGGACSKSGCDNEGFECAGDGVCVRTRRWDPAPILGFHCAAPCEQGAEAVALQTGVDGHAEDCRDGYMCLWNGVPADPSGSCTPGNYNSVSASNIGAACAGREACWSPMGHGICMNVQLGARLHTMCTVMDCQAPGLPDGVCGSSAECVLLPDGHRTACMMKCDVAADCAPGLGCVDVDATAAFAGMCHICSSSTECRDGEQCVANVCVP